MRKVGVFFLAQEMFYRQREIFECVGPGLRWTRYITALGPAPTARLTVARLAPPPPPHPSANNM